jgi:hypothetical protein
MDFPTNWQQVTPTPAGAIYISRSPDGSKVAVVNVAALPAYERSAGIAEALAGSKESAVKDGFRTDPEQSLTVNGVPFRYYVAHPSATGTVTTYAAVAGHELYVLALVNKNGDTFTDSELHTVVQSFHLLAPAEIPRSVDASRSAAYNVGYRMGLVLGGLICLAILVSVVALLIYFAFLKRKPAPTGQTPPPLPPQ